MPLLDPFHPPLSTMRHWESFHAQWAGSIAHLLNETLPEGYFAEAQVHAGPRIEVDVATFQDTLSKAGVATLPKAMPKLSPPDHVFPFAFPPGFVVHVYETSGGPTLVAAVELVSPANKDREESRQAFASKCLSYLSRGQGLLVVDVVTNRNSRPLDDLAKLMRMAVADSPPLAAASYRPLRGNEGDSIELRLRALQVGDGLPELPLALDEGKVATVDLEASYEEARERSRL